MSNKLQKARQAALALIDGFLPSIKAPLQDNIDLIYHAAVDAKKPAHEAADKDKTIHEQRDQIDYLRHRVRALEGGANLLAAENLIRSQAAELQQRSQQLDRQRADNDHLRRQLKEAKANEKPTTVFEAVNLLVDLLGTAGTDGYEEVFHCMCSVVCAYTVTCTGVVVNDDRPAFVKSVRAHMSRVVKAIADDWR